MFLKRKKIGEVHKVVIDWDAIIGWVVVGGIVIVLLSNCGG